MANDLTVHIVDDDETHRKSLTLLLISAGFAVRADSSNSAFQDQLPFSDRACVVKVMRSSRFDGFQLLETIDVLGIDIPVIFISGDGDIATAVRAMRAGAADFIEMPFEGDILIAAIDRVTARAAARSAPNAVREKTACRLRRLTTREHQVLEAILDGMQNKTIAFNLGISPRTVEVYRANVMAKMEARNLADLVRMVLTSGEIVPLPPTDTALPAMRSRLL